MANEKVGIEIELMGGEEAYNLLKRIDTQIDTLNKKKKFKSLGGLNSAKSELESYMKELGELEQKADRVRKVMDKWGDPFKKSAAGQRLNQELKEAEKRAEEIRGEMKGMGSDMDSVTRKTRTFKQEMNSISSTVAHIGSAMQSLGNALTRLTSPFRRITTGLLMGAGYKALNLVTEGLGGAFERADTMKNYSRTLKAFFGDTEDVADSAEQAIQRLNDAVLGLPTGLDEIVAVQKRFLAASQDIEKSTDLAIAYNNAILASGSDARQQKTAQRILTQLAGGAEIASSSWDALQRAIPLVFTALAKEADMGVSDYVSALKTGKITTDEFVKSFTRIGQEGAISAAAEVMKKSWGGLQANITNRFKAMGEGIIESLHEVFTEQTGRDLLDTLLGIDAEGNRTNDGLRDWIDGISNSIQKWIKAHPEEIINFFNDLKSIDWKGLLKGVAEGAGEVAKLISAFAKWASGKDLSQVGKWAVRLNILGNILTVLGGFLKGTRHIWGFLGALGKFGKEGLLGKLFGGIFGKGGGALGEGIGSTIGSGIGKGTFLGVGKIGLLAAEITGIVGALTTLVSGFAALDMKLLSSAFKSFREIMENLKAGLDVMQEIKSTEYDKDALSQTIKEFGQVYKELDSLEIKPLKAKKIAKSTDAIWTAIHNIRRIAYQINRAAGTTINQEGLSAFVTQINDALNELNNIGEHELDISIKLSAGFDKSVNAVVKKIKDVKTKVNNALNSIPTNYTKTLSVTIKASVNTRGAIEAINRGASNVRGIANNITPATGGMVYRAKGGGIPWKRRGTDVVPAMLTPGEYVHNRRAVSKFGIDFMRKVNNLDVKGAMNELMHRAGSMANVNRGMNVTNNYNNNQKVVINNNGNTGAGYTFKSASRFVGAF